jgi:hypothetical protein
MSGFITEGVFGTQDIESRAVRWEADRSGLFRARGASNRLRKKGGGTPPGGTLRGCAPHVLI